MNTEILSGLNPAQKEAVETLEGPLLILAGAGSGKTRTLTHRIANLIANGVAPTNILAVTFTNKAANEMRERLWKLLYSYSSRIDHTKVSYPIPFQGAPNQDVSIPRSFMPYMGTFHGICVKILRIEAEAAGLHKDFVIYDADDQVSLIKRIIKNLNLSGDKSLKPKSIQSIISHEKNQGNGPEEYSAVASYPKQQQIAKIFAKYEREKSVAGALDFDDLLLKVLELFATNKAVCKKWRDKFQHILIDEYQDTNVIQYKIVKLLVNEKRNICVVGDDWQSIYSWRGADFTNILNFTKDFPGAKVIKLEENYRSTGNILEAAQKIIRKNEMRTDKTLFTNLGAGSPVEIESLRDETAEANFVALTITKMLKDYPDYADFTVLYRTNAQSYTFEKALIERNIPYKIIGGVRFYDRKEVKDVLAILKLILNQHDKVSLERVVKNVLSGIGEASLAKILMAMESLSSKEKPLFDPDLPDVLKTGKAKNGLMRLVNFLRKITEEETKAPSEIIKNIITYFDFKTLTDDGTPSATERMENLAVLISIAGTYEELEEFLADATLMSSADEKSAKNSVTLMTMHAAKGLEFPVVFMVGMEEGLFPSARAEEKADLEEERRLAYVGMTRAMRKLFLTYTASRYSFGERNFNMPSRFLTELGYNPYGSAGYSKEIETGFSNDDFNDYDNFDNDPFPEDVPVYE